MAMPPLYRTPNLSRLLGPDEIIIYTCKLHPLHGIRWLLSSLVLVGIAWWLSWYFLIPAAACFLVYYLPFRNTEIAVTTHRLLLRYGRFKIHSNIVDPEHLDHYQLHQTALSNSLHYGTLILNLDTLQDIRTLTLRDLWHPMTLLEALATLNPTFRGHQASTT